MSRSPHKRRRSLSAARPLGVELCEPRRVLSADSGLEAVESLAAPQDVAWLVAPRPAAPVAPTHSGAFAGWTPIDRATSLSTVAGASGALDSDLGTVVTIVGDRFADPRAESNAAFLDAPVYLIDQSFVVLIDQALGAADGFPTDTPILAQYPNLEAFGRQFSDAFAVLDTHAGFGPITSSDWSQYSIEIDDSSKLPASLGFGGNGQARDAAPQPGLGSPFLTFDGVLTLQELGGDSASDRSADDQSAGVVTGDFQQPDGMIDPVSPATPSLARRVADQSTTSNQSRSRDATPHVDESAHKRDRRDGDLLTDTPDDEFGAEDDAAESSELAKASLRRVRRGATPGDHPTPAAEGEGAIDLVALLYPSESRFVNYTIAALPADGGASARDEALAARDAALAVESWTRPVAWPSAVGVQPAVEAGRVARPNQSPIEATPIEVSNSADALRDTTAARGDSPRQPIWAYALSTLLGGAVVWGLRKSDPASGTPCLERPDRPKKPSRLA